MTEAKTNSDLRADMTKGKDPHELPWYKTDFEEVPDPAKTILENYSKIQPDRILQHVMNVFPYPCIGSFRFLDMSISKLPVYPEILSRLKSGQKLLDVGCAIGQEIRHLVYNGVQSENIYASDLGKDFFSIGYDLFADRETLKSTFIDSDIFDDNSDLVKTLTDNMDIINAASFFHLFTWDQQITVAKRLVSLLRAQPGSLLVGRQVGRFDAVDPSEAKGPFRHNMETWKRLWEQVQADTGTKWVVEGWEEEWVDTSNMMKEFHGGMETSRLWFIVRRT
ncbi:hypothetical protein N7466_004750 [Penicillium verhagenii]|uniref:uncharacterized protein n=1 Tax=Penicillium verhagenii TaxID=1562060 RepID=UPI0025450256|nr:uncharacterized protein N7466_004750 [Penicillium verhagenii]KAJ5935203.1 hypothetical protein N7466_004750 [Penicillium verhagenii]